MDSSRIKAIIVEDMAEYIATIELLLQEVAPSVIVAGKATKLSEAERLIKVILPDVVFLDIQFENEGKTCFDLLEIFKNDKRYGFQIVIITAHIEKHYYAKAFEYKALHFLDKPLNKNKLAEAVNRISETMVGFRLNSLTALFETEIGSIKTDSKSVKINIEGVFFNEIIDKNDIVWIEADGRKSNIYLQNKKQIISTSSIGVFEKKLEVYNEFLRINRSEIINIEFVLRYSKKEKLVLLNDNPRNFYVSKDMFATFVEKMNS